MLVEIINVEEIAQVWDISTINFSVCRDFYLRSLLYRKNIRATFSVILISFCFFSCDAQTPKYRSVKLNNINLDTLSRIEYLFTKEEIEIKTNPNKIIDQIKSYGTMDRFGNIYLIGLNSEIYRINKNGILLKTFSNYGKGPGEYINISKILVDNECNIYMLDFFQEKILIYDSLFKYKSTITLEPTGVTDMVLGEKGTIICYDAFQSENIIYIYNSKNGQLSAKYGKPDNLVLKYLAFYTSQSIDYDNGRIFYAYPLQYKITAIEKNYTTSNIRPKSSYFKQISKPVVNALHRDLKNKFSTIYWFRVLAEGYFIIQIIHPNESDESRNDIFFDIVSFDGKIIKEKLIFENIGFLTKIADGTFMTITYPEISFDGSTYVPNPIINIYKLKSM